MICTICKKDANTKHLDLYVTGSEGVNLCKTCEIDLCHHILDVILNKQSERKAEQKVTSVTP